MGPRTRKAKVISATGVRIITDKAQIPATFHEHLDFDSPSTYYFLYLDANPIGCAQIIDYGEQVFELAYVYILEPFRRQGYGRSFVQFAIYNHPSQRIHALTIIPQYFEQLGFTRANTYPAFIIK